VVLVPAIQRGRGEESAPYRKPLQIGSAKTRMTIESATGDLYLAEINCFL
jgi:hypothetical protein